MPYPEISHLYNKALLWVAAGNDKFGRHRRAALSILLDCRWNDYEAEALDPNGNTITVDATVEVTRDIRIGSIMWRGNLDDLTALLGSTATYASIPTDSLFEVVTFNATQDLRCMESYRIAGLKRYTDTMPT